MKFLVLCSILLLFCSVQCDEDEYPRVRVKQGEIKGKTLTTFKNRKIYSFRGIPYAKPPTQERRFKLPEPTDPWDSILDATKDGPGCPQNHFITKQTIGEEDCLVLNVYTPELPSETNSRKLPVLVFIHGGGFVFGESTSSLYGPKRLLDKDIVLVAINYRLGALGFLSTGDDVVPGNLGLWDQNLALKWIQDNIQAFGGDPASVTLFGESAGAASVQYHLLSKASEGLFHRGILQSGSVLCPWATQPNPLSASQTLAKLLECPVTSTKMLVQCLREKSAEDIVKKTELMDQWPSNKLIFVPVAEKNTNSPKFLEDEPRSLLEKGLFHRYPIITGINKDEGVIYILGLYQKLKKLDSSFLEKHLDTFLTSYLTPEAAPKLRELYFKDTTADNFDETEFTKNLIEVNSDIYFKAANEDTVKYSSKHVPTYVYILEETSKYNFARLFGFQEILGVSHADDLPYLFDGLLAPVPLEGKDKEISEAIIEKWTNFAKFGDPNGDGELKPWKPTSPDHVRYFRFGYPMETVDYKSSDKIAELKKIQKQFKIKPQVHDEL